MSLRARYRQLIPVESARTKLLKALGDQRVPSEEIAAENAAGRVTAHAVHAAISSPPYHAAAMDGIAVKTSMTFGASETRPLLLPVDAVQPIDTGDPMPADFDAVIPVERILEKDEGIEIRQAVSARQNVRLCGEDMVAGEMILASGRRIRPEHVGAMLQANVCRLSVRRRVRVAVLPTGDELCEPGQDPSDGKVIESNSRMLTALIESWGAEAKRLPPQPDDPKQLTPAIEQALADPAVDLMLILAGSSAGRGDFTPRLIESHGELLFHGVSCMPGKPMAAGIWAGKPVIGLPGFPVSAMVAAETLLRPALDRLSGCAVKEPERIQAKLNRAVASRPGMEEWLRVLLGRFDSGWVAAPLGRGAGAITTLSRAHGILRVATDSEGIPAGQMVEVELLQSPSEICDGLLFAGSHDMALAVLDDALAGSSPGMGIHVTPLGSLGGLAALARGEAHMAGCHLLDPQSGTYNVKAVARIMGSAEVALITLAHRQQGLCLRPDQDPMPKDLSAAAQQGLRFVNRQPGAGTRLLSDHLMTLAGLTPKDLPGYDHEEFTHVAVAEAVRSKAADCGMLIEAAARALNLKFLPLVEERFDLVLPRAMLEDPRITALRVQLESADWQAAVEALGGYDTRESGRIRCLPKNTWSI